MKIHTIGLGIFLILVAGLLGCTAPKVNYAGAGAWNESRQKSLHASVQWVKFKSKKIDVQYTLKNDYTVPVLVRATSARPISSHGKTINAVKSPADALLSPGDSSLGVATFPNDGSITRTEDFILRFDQLTSEGKALPVLDLLISKVKI